MLRRNASQTIPLCVKKLIDEYNHIGKEHLQKKTQDQCIDKDNEWGHTEPVKKQCANLNIPALL